MIKVYNLKSYPFGFTSVYGEKEFIIHPKCYAVLKHEEMEYLDSISNAFKDNWLSKENIDKLIEVNNNEILKNNYCSIAAGFGITSSMLDYVLYAVLLFNKTGELTIIGNKNEIIKLAAYKGFIPEKNNENDYGLVGTYKNANVISLQNNNKDGLIYIVPYEIINENINNEIVFKDYSKIGLYIDISN